MPPKSPAPLPRQLIEEPSYTIGLKKLRINYKDLDAALDKLSWAICTRPEIFPEVLDTGVHRLKVNGYGRFPDLAIWFTFTSERVKLHYVEIALEE